ncbi:hypothetical protein G5B30_09945 [Sphingobacterium sp. SGG-5]|uniref:hypothetical protein n=1 Tax=Sphingobacterium sp. SGG-5 TaxID=2710881 RepID=UPI0013ED8137|nr:hypothetical protein [Sphingobacterium sp. SGG-5]NGM62236.1 hypothetical protein [Sphingobacterium sp. SGG-5]
MNKEHKPQGGRQGLSSIFSRLFGVLAVIFLVVGLMACSKNDPDVGAEPMDLTKVGVDLQGGIITGTTTAMEYSLNSTDGVDGDWEAASDGSTVVAFGDDGRVYIRETTNPANVRLVISLGSDNMDLVYLSDVSVDIAEGIIKGTTTEMEYSLNSTDGTDGDWLLASDVNTAVTFAVGRVYVRAASDHTHKRPVAIIAAPAAAPNLVADDISNIIVGLAAVHEYRVDGGDWIAGPNGPDLTGDKSVEVRIKATAVTLASEAQTLTFTTDPVDIVVFEHHFDGAETLEELGYALSSTKAVISDNMSVSGTKSLAFLETSGTRNIGRYFNSENTAEKYENVTVELWVKLDLQAAQSANTLIGLYDGTTSVARVSNFSTTIRYYAGATITEFNPVTSVIWDEWFKLRIEMVGATFNVYRDGVLLGSGLATDGGRTEVNRLYFSTSSANTHSYFDDIKVTYKPQ